MSYFYSNNNENINSLPLRIIGSFKKKLSYKLNSFRLILQPSVASENEFSHLSFVVVQRIKEADTEWNLHSLCFVCNNPPQISRFKDSRTINSSFILFVFLERKLYAKRDTAALLFAFINVVVVDAKRIKENVKIRLKNFSATFSHDNCSLTWASS